MMLYPSVFPLIAGERKCRYSLVIAVAKKARELSEEADKNGKPLDEKSVSLAIKMLEDGKIDYREPEHNEVISGDVSLTNIPSFSFDQNLSEK